MSNLVEIKNENNKSYAVVRLYAREVSLENGNSFLTYSTNVNGKFYQVKYRKEVSFNKKPSAKGIYVCEFDLDLINIKDEKVIKKEDKAVVLNPIIWVTCDDAVRELHKVSDEELQKENAEKVKNIFNPLPF